MHAAVPWPFLAVPWTGHAAPACCALHPIFVANAHLDKQPASAHMYVDSSKKNECKYPMLPCHANPHSLIPSVRVVRPIMAANRAGNFAVHDVRAGNAHSVHATMGNAQPVMCARPATFAAGAS